MSSSTLDSTSPNSTADDLTHISESEKLNHEAGADSDKPHEPLTPSIDLPRLQNGDLNPAHSSNDHSSNTHNNASLDLEHQQTYHSHHSTPTIHPTHTAASALERPQSLPHEIAFVAILCLTQLTTQAALGQSVAPLHIIGASLGTTSPGELSWFPAAYSLTVGTFILPAGRLGDLYGHKKMVVIGYTWFALWSIVAGCAVYSGQILFDISRAFQGMGPALLLPNAIAILGRAYKPGRRKEMVFSLFGATAPSGFVIGAAGSTLLAQEAWWPWGYWIFGIFLALASGCAWFVVPYTAPAELEKGESAWVLTDALGGGLGVAGLVLINFAWNQAPVVGWQTPYTYVLLIVGFIFMGLFAYVELKIARFPLIPLSAMKRETGFVLACMCFGWSGFGVWIYYLWQFLEELRHVSPLLGTAQTVPTMFSGFAAAITTGLIMSRVPGSVVMIIAMLAFTIGLALLVTAPVGQSYWAQTFVSMLVMPWGMDMSFPAANLLLSNSMPKAHQGVSASLVNTVINYSISLSLGISGTIETQVSGGSLLKGYRGAWYFGIGMTVAGVVCAGLMGLVGWRDGRRGSVGDEKAGEGEGEGEGDINGGGNGQGEAQEKD